MKTKLICLVMLMSVLVTACPVATVYNPPVYAPLEARDLSLANTTAPALKRADLTALTSDFGPKIIPWLLACSRTSYWNLPGYGTGDLAYRQGGVITGGKIDAYFETPWLARALAAYMQQRDTATPQQQVIIDQWFYENAHFTLRHMQSFLKLNFPDREIDSYSRKQGAATSNNFVEPARYATQGGDRLSLIAMWYNNRRSMAYLYLLMAGVAFQETKPAFAQQLTAEVKRYIKEWITYSVYPTGETGEWIRNHEYPNATTGEYIEGQGLTYNAYNSAMALIAAMVLDKKTGDTDLLEFSTRDGMNGTECTTGEASKTIWTASNLHIDLLTGHQSRTNDAGQLIQVVWDYPTYDKRNELFHATWYLPAYKTYMASSVWGERIATWAAGRNQGWGGRIDDPFERWRGMSGISTDVRTEDFSWMQSFSL